MPAIHSAWISTSLLATLGDATVIGPVLVGLDAPVQIAPLGATVSDIVTFATIAAFDAATKPG
jgi:malate dehydrogenase (oxaloacetate-decarboxylating)(NADP+)